VSWDPRRRPAARDPGRPGKALDRARPGRPRKKSGLPIRRQMHNLTAMQTIGERLEEARKRKGISIREASEATKNPERVFATNSRATASISTCPRFTSAGSCATTRFYLKLNGDKLMADYRTLIPSRAHLAPRQPRDLWPRGSRTYAHAHRHNRFGSRHGDSTAPSPSTSVQRPFDQLSSFRQH